ncbi:MAG: hypothetical protein VX346_11050 [Planctomycetota bacterium]|nr:hypothetical protein [Planctomycetota bacterium]
MTKQVLKDSYHKLVRRAGRLQISLLSVLALAITVTGYVCLANGPFDGSYFRTRSFRPDEAQPPEDTVRDGYKIGQFKRVQPSAEKPADTVGQSPQQSGEYLPEVLHAPLVATEPVSRPRAVTSDADVGNTESSVPSAAGTFSGEWFSTEELVLPQQPTPLETVSDSPADESDVNGTDTFSGALFSTAPFAGPVSDLPEPPADLRPAVEAPVVEAPVVEAPVVEERPVVDAFSGELFSPGWTALPTESASQHAVRKADDVVPQPILKREVASTTPVEEPQTVPTGQVEAELPALTRAEAATMPEAVPGLAPSLSRTPAIIRPRGPMSAEIVQQPAQIVAPPRQREPSAGSAEPITEMLAAREDEADLNESVAPSKPGLGLPPVVDRVEQPFAGPFVPSVTPSPMAEPTALPPVSLPTEPVAPQQADDLQRTSQPGAPIAPEVAAEDLFVSPAPVVDQLPESLAPVDIPADDTATSPGFTPPSGPEVPFQSVLETTPAPQVHHELAPPTLPTEVLELAPSQLGPPVVATQPLLPVSDAVIPQDSQLPMTAAPVVVSDQLIPTAAVEAGTGVMDPVNQSVDGLGFICPDTWYVRVEMPHFNREGNKGVSYSDGFRLDDFSFEPGGRMVLGRQRDCLEGWELIFTGMFEWEVEDERDHRFDGDAGEADFFTTLVPIDVNASSFQGAPYQASRFRSRFDSLELVTKRWGWDVISCTSGIRYIDVKEEFELYSIATDESIGHLRMNTQNKAVGYQLGVDVYYPVGRWTMEGNLKGSVNANLARGQFRLENGGPFPDFGTLFGNDFSTVCFSGLVELGYHMNYQLSERMKLRAGYEAIFLYGMATAVEQLRDGTLRVNTGTHAETERWIVYHGGTFGLEISW